MMRDNIGPETTISRRKLMTVNPTPTVPSAARRLRATLLLAAALVVPGTASALPTINGAIALNPAVGTTWSYLGTCTDVTDCSGFTLSPTTNNIVVAGTFGSFTSVAIGTVGTMSDVNTANVPILPQWSVGPFSFDLLTANVINVYNLPEYKVLIVSGSGVAKGTGFADTFGQWVWSATSQGSGSNVTFSFNAFSTGDGIEAPPTPVTEPGLLVGLGAGLLALGFGVRRRQRTAPQG